MERYVMGLMSFVLILSVRQMGRAQDLGSLSEPTQLPVTESEWTPSESTASSAATPGWETSEPTFAQPREGAVLPEQEGLGGVDQSSGAKPFELKIIRDPFESALKRQGGLKNPKILEIEAVPSQTLEESSDQDRLDTLTDTFPPPSPGSPFTRFLLREYQLQAILWNVQEPKAIYKSPSGELIKVKIGYRIGREGGVVWKIREKEVLILIPYKGDFKNARVYSHKMWR